MSPGGADAGEVAVAVLFRHPLPGLLAACLLQGEARAEEISLTVDSPQPLVLGEIDRVPVTIIAPETKDTKDRPLRVSVNVGSFGPIQPVRSGVYRAMYDLPK